MLLWGGGCLAKVQHLIRASPPPTGCLSVFLSEVESDRSCAVWRHLTWRLHCWR
jgi:hypothetical protein